MIITLNDQQMLELWRLGAGLVPPALDCSIERFDAIDVDARLRYAMRSWYVDYLQTAPPDMVDVTDLTSYCRVSGTVDPDRWTVRLMCDTARVTELETVDRGAVAVIDPGDPEARPTLARLQNRMTRHGSRPVALYIPGTNRLTLYLKSRTVPEIASVRGVRVTDDDVFTVDERVLARIPELAVKALT